MAIRSLNPLRCSGTELAPNLLLAAKLIALPELWFNAPGSLPEPFLPFVPVFDWVGHPVLVQRGLQALAYAGAVGILVNLRVRAACLALGSAILLSILSNRGSYYNNALYCSCVLLLIGLDGDKGTGRRPWLVQAQVVLLYTGAGLNKLLDPDWRSGQFFETWTTLIHQATYLHVKTWFPPMALSRALSWVTITSELGMALALPWRRTSLWAVRAGMAFHTALSFFFGYTFGLFYFALMASYLAFVPWPEGQLAAFYDAESAWGRRLQRVLGWLDVDGRFTWAPLKAAARAEAPLALRVGGRLYAGGAAVRKMLLCTPATYLFFGALVALGLTRNVELTPLGYGAMALVLAFFLPPSTPERR
jgi:hypothetical protein